MKRLGPDERTYWNHASAWKEWGAIGLLSYAASYLRSRDRVQTGSGAEPCGRDICAALPSPIRWGWAIALSVTDRAAMIFGALLSVITLSPPGPLTAHLSTRLSQDTAVAFGTVGAILAAWHGMPITCGIAFAVTLAIKPEGALLAVPAVMYVAPDRILAALALAMAGSLYCLATMAIFGAAVSRGLWRAMAQSHDTEYGRTEQKGLPHRLPIDLAIVSPVYIGAALWHLPSHPLLIAAALIVAAHACTPVRNVRTVLAADVLIRMWAWHDPAVSWPVLVVGFAFDVAIWRRMRAIGLYDTPTNRLVDATLRGRP